MLKEQLYTEIRFSCGFKSLQTHSLFTGHFPGATPGLLTPKDTEHATLPQLEGALAVRKRTKVKDEGGLGATVLLPTAAFQSRDEPKCLLKTTSDRVASDPATPGCPGLHPT